MFSSHQKNVASSPKLSKGFLGHDITILSTIYIDKIYCDKVKISMQKQMSKLDKFKIHKEKK